jgi:Tfp pilus assembly protein PilO
LEAIMSNLLKMDGISKKLLIPVCVFGALLLVGGGALVYYLMNLQSAVDRRIAKKQTQVGADSQITRRYETARAEYDAATEPLKHLEGAIPASSYIPTLVQQLQLASQKRQIKLSGLRPGAALDDTPAPAASGSKGRKVARPAYKQVVMTIQAEGTFNQIMGFISDLNSFPKIVAVNSISLSPKSVDSSAQNSSPKLNANIGIVAYQFDDDAASAASPQNRQSASQKESTNAGSPV